MKKLMLMGALLLSIGAFAQRPGQPGVPPFDGVFEECVFFEVPPIWGGSNIDHYLVRYCAFSTHSLDKEGIERDVKDYFFKNGHFPSDVVVIETVYKRVLLPVKPTLGFEVVDFNF